jgi:RNA polymerase subunit RPABC4/transcription elongation factor Spt4
MSEEENQDIPMAECGACESIIPLDSESCSNCGIRFGGVSEEHLGECGACGKLQPVDSTSCTECGVSFVADEVDETTIEDTPEEAVIDISVDDANDILAEESMAVETATDDDEVPQEESPEDDEIAETDDVAEIEISEDDEASEEELEDDLEEDPEEEDESIDSEEVEESEIEDDEQEDDSEDGDSEDSEDEVDDEEDDEPVEVDNTIVVMAFENLALAIAGSGMTASEAFMDMDTSDDNLIDAPELQKGIEKIGGESLKPSEVTAILNYLDSNENNRVDSGELIKALDDLKIGIKPGKMPRSKRVKEFPSPTQKFLMGKTANDIFYPVAYFLMITIIGLFVANGFAIPGASGEGGNVLYEGEGENWNHCGTDIGDTLGETCSGFVNDGQIYPCDVAVDPNECRNSITLFSGESGDNGALNSMPKGFYMDGIIFIILGIIGLGATAYLHMSYAPALRKRAKGDDGDSEADSADDDEELEDDDDDDDDALQSPKDLVIEDTHSDNSEDDDDDSDEDDDDDSDEDDDDDSDEDDDEDGDDDIDVGDWVGIEIDGEEFFGEIIEFDDDEGTVTIETEDGDEVTGDQDEMFLEDDDE